MRIRYACSVGALMVVPALVGAQSRERPDTPEVRTAASADRSVQPDLAIVTLEFAAHGTTPSQAGRRLAAKADSLRQALATLGIPRDSMVNRSRWYWWRGRIEVVPQPVRYIQRQTPNRLYSEPVQDTLYRAHDAIQVRIRDLTKVGAVLDTAMGRGITEIIGVQFIATNIAGAQEEALREATVRARRQAEAIAVAGGMNLGAVLSLGTQPDYRYEYSSYDLRSALSVSGASEQGNAPTQVIQPAIPVSVTVYGRWSLVKKP